MFETDDPTTILKDIAVWAPMFRFELFPVLDVLDASRLQQEAVDFRDANS